MHLNTISQPSLVHRSCGHMNYGVEKVAVARQQTKNMQSIFVIRNIRCVCVFAVNLCEFFVLAEHGST